MDEHLALFVLGVLRGAVDWERRRQPVLGNASGPDSMMYFGSSFRYHEFAAKAIELGLVVANPEEFTETALATWAEHLPTDAGRAFYEKWCLAEFPPGRAYSWQGDMVDAAIKAVMKLEASRG